MPSKAIRELTNSITDLDPISFAENHFTVNTQPLKLRGCGRDYLHEIYHTIAFDSMKRGSPRIIWKKGRKVEASTSAIILGCYFLASGLFKHITILHVFPLVGQGNAFSNDNWDKLIRTAKDDFITKQKDLEGDWTVGHKKFRDFNQLYITGLSGNADRLRFIATDVILFDEIQDSERDGIEVATESFGRSNYQGWFGFGTPKEKGSLFERYWEDSDQRFYHVKCIYCDNYFVVSLENFITGEFIKCPKCNKLQDKKFAVFGGKWVPTKSSKYYRGYHLDQLLVPGVTREEIEMKRDSTITTPRQFANDVLGEFYSSSVIAPGIAEIVKKNADITEKFSEICRPPKMTFMGIDWGGRSATYDKGSYTVVVIISVTPEGKFKIEFAHAFSIDSRALQLKDINRWIREFNSQEVVPDAGWGFSEIQDLQESWFDRIKPCNTLGNTFGGTRDISYKWDKEMGVISANKHLVLEEVLEGFKRGKWIFPYAQPEKIDWLVEHCTNIEISVRNQGGRIVREINKKEGKQNDGLMALMYAYIAARFKQTRGFDPKFLSSNFQNQSATKFAMPRTRLARVRSGRPSIIDAIRQAGKVS